MAGTLCGLFMVSMLLTISSLNGQFPKKEKFSAVKEEIPYIKCETCQKAVKYLYWKTKEMRGNAAAKKASSLKDFKKCQKVLVSNRSQIGVHKSNMTLL